MDLMIVEMVLMRKLVRILFEQNNLSFKMKLNFRTEMSKCKDGGNKVR